MRILSPERCRAELGGYTFTNGMLCAEWLGGTRCAGGGAPLQLTQADEVVQVGIASWGTPFGHDGCPGA